MPPVFVQLPARVNELVSAVKIPDPDISTLPVNIWVPLFRSIVPFWAVKFLVLIFHVWVSIKPA